MSYCCKMREALAVGILGFREGHESLPMEAMDFQISDPESGATVLAFQYCPWCGESLEGQTRQVNQVDIMEEGADFGFEKEE